MLLFNSPVSGNCYKVRLLAARLGLQLELRELDVVDRSDRREVIGALNPARRVPVLVLDDGRPLAESNAIISYLAQGTEYVLEDRYEHAKVLQWLFFEQYSHEPHIAVARFWSLSESRSASRSAARSTSSGTGLWRLLSTVWPTAPSWPEAATRSPISRCMPTRTSPAKAASSWRLTRRPGLAAAGGSPARAHPDHRLSRRPRNASRRAVSRSGIGAAGLRL